MENQVEEEIKMPPKEAGWLLLIKRFFPYVVAVGFAWYALRKDDQLRDKNKEYEDHLKDDLNNYRDAYRKQMETNNLLQNLKNGNQKTD